MPGGLRAVAQSSGAAIVGVARESYRSDIRNADLGHHVLESLDGFDDSRRSPGIDNQEQSISRRLRPDLAAAFRDKTEDNHLDSAGWSSGQVCSDDSAGCG